MDGSLTCSIDESSKLSREVSSGAMKRFLSKTSDNLGVGGGGGVLLNSASNTKIGAICLWNKFPCDLDFSFLFEGEPPSTWVSSGASSNTGRRTWDSAGSGDRVDTVARRCLEGVWISGICICV
jgi:hypothetical protein